jgi:hypothetical protein
MWISSIERDSKVVAFGGNRQTQTLSPHFRGKLKPAKVKDSSFLKTQNGEQIRHQQKDQTYKVPQIEYCIFI